MTHGIDDTVEIVINAVEHETRDIEVKLSEKDAQVLTSVLETIFSSVRSGKVDEVKEVTGVSSMLEAAHLITIRNALRKI